MPACSPQRPYAAGTLFDNRIESRFHGRPPSGRLPCAPAFAREGTASGVRGGHWRPAPAGSSSAHWRRRAQDVFLAGEPEAERIGQRGHRDSPHFRGCPLFFPHAGSGENGDSPFAPAGRGGQMGTVPISPPRQAKIARPTREIGTVPICRMPRTVGPSGNRVGTVARGRGVFCWLSVRCRVGIAGRWSRNDV